jgi:hypothetical protein
MARWHAHAIVVAALACAASAAAQPAGDARRFDGTWSVRLVCPTAPDGALGYTFVFPVTVSGGHLHGQRGTPGQPSSVTYDGTVRPDGRATIAASGLTGDPSLNVGRVPRGYAYAYSFIAQFDATHGHGQRTEGRPCVIDLTRQ